MVLGIAFLGIFGKRWLPDREPAPELMMARFTGSELEEFYQLGERLWEVRVPAGSVFANISLADSGIGERFNLAVAGIWHKNQAIFAPPPGQLIYPGDILLVVGREERVTALAAAGVQLGRENSGERISERGVSFFEVMPSPHSQALGHTLKELEFRNKFGLTALALFRSGKSFRTDVGNFPLQLGDSLLMIGSPRYLKSLQNHPDYIVLEPDLSDQPLQRKQVLISISILALAIMASIMGLPVYLAMLSGAVILTLLRVLDMEEAYRSINWQVILVIAGMYSISLAMVNTGLSALIGDRLLSFLRFSGPLGLALGSYLLSALFTQLIGGQVTALVTGPITISAALSMHADPHAIAVATAIGCSASFLTPIAHPVNILMIAPANYKFQDFFHIGWKLTVVCFAALSIGMILFWNL
jgi:di/tricarboxylate transporter